MRRTLAAWALRRTATYEAGAITGVAGPPFAGFGAGNKAMTISSLAGDVIIPPQPINVDQFTITCWFKRTGPACGGAGAGV